MMLKESEYAPMRKSLNILITLKSLKAAAPAGDKTGI